MSCVSTASMQLLWNDAVSTSFLPTRAVRQGDPFSPYLFVLGMERLGHLINAAVKENQWDPIRLVRGGRVSRIYSLQMTCCCFVELLR